MEKNLPSKKQRELLSFIEGFIKGNGYGPSYREIMRALDYKSVSTVAIHINGLITKGYLYKRDKSARSLEVIGGRDSGKPVEKPDNMVHKMWLKQEVEARADAVVASQSSAKAKEIDILVAALRILGMTNAAVRIEARLAAIKDLDQTPS